MNRHFKKYYFYFLARILDLFDQYDKSLSNYSKVIRYRTFFWDVQSRYIAAYQKSTKKSYLEIHGGIGDFLQHLPFILKHKNTKYIVVTHFKSAEQFFKDLGIKIEKYYFYSSKDEYRMIQNLLKKEKDTHICPRELFFKIFPFDKNQDIKNNKKNIVGIHMGASLFASTKAIPIYFIENLIGHLHRIGCKIILFGTKQELLKIKISKSKNIVIASDKNIIKNLSLVRYCNLLIGSDSAFKTMSAMLKIPTIVLFHNSKNNFRDRVFIQPYVNEHIMYIYQYTNFNEREMELALKYILNVMPLNFNSF